MLCVLQQASRKKLALPYLLPGTIFNDHLIQGLLHLHPVRSLSLSLPSPLSTTVLLPATAYPVCFAVSSFLFSFLLPNLITCSAISIIEFGARELHLTLVLVQRVLRFSGRCACGYALRQLRCSVRSPLFTTRADVDRWTPELHSNTHSYSIQNLIIDTNSGLLSHVPLSDASFPFISWKTSVPLSVSYDSDELTFPDSCCHAVLVSGLAARLSHSAHEHTFTYRRRERIMGNEGKERL